LISLKFEDGYSYVKSNGQYPSICTNNKGWVIQVYHLETVIGLRLRYTVGFQSDGMVTWSDNIKTYDRGFYPCIAMNDSGLVVAVYGAQLGYQMFYKLGRLSYDEITTSQSHFIPDKATVDGASIEWLETGVIGEGHNPDVSINNNNTVVVVYERRSIKWPWVRAYYRIGDIKEEALNWRQPDSDKRLLESGSSKHVSVSLNDKEEVAIGYSSGVERAVHFVVGIILNGSIQLGSNKFSPTGVSYEPVISLNNDGYVVAVHHILQGRLSLKINYGLLRHHDVTRLTSMEWSLPSSRTFANNAYHSSVAITDSKRVLTVYKSLVPRIKKSLRNKIGELTCYNDY
jgi:hypothetical protein